MALFGSYSWSLSNKYLLRLSLLSVTVFVLDQISKKLALIYLGDISRKEVLGSFLQLTLVFNEGGAFSTKLGSTLFYTIASIIVMIFILSFLFREAGKNRFLDFALSLVVGGALGNLVDRLRFGSVIDFIDLDFFDIHIPPAKILFVNFPGYDLTRWPVFNVADSAVTVGMVLIVLVLFFDSRRGRDADNTSDS